MTDVEIETLKQKFDYSRKNISLIIIEKNLPTTDDNALLQFGNKVKVLPVRKFESIHILFQSVSDDISDSIDGKDKDSWQSKEKLWLDNSLKLTSNSCSLNNCAKIISYKSTSIILMMQKLVITNL